MGGGTTIVEANRIGAKTIGSDINPVAYWTVKESIKPIDVNKLINYFNGMEQTAGEKIRFLYNTSCSDCGGESEGLYYFWLREIECPFCKENVVLFNKTLLNFGFKRNKGISKQNPATVFCPFCFKIDNWDGNKEGMRCSHCGKKFNPLDGSFTRGYFRCAKCNNENISLIKTVKSGKEIKNKLIAIEYWCEICKKRKYKSPDTNDNLKLARIESEFEINKERLRYPKQKILEGESSHRWRQHGYTHYYQLFNSRQIIAFNYIFDEIRKIPEKEYRDSFATIFSNALEYNNMMTPYNFPHRKLHHLFTYHALPFTPIPVENSVWGCGDEGAGTFVNCYHRYINAKKYCLQPYDKFKDSKGKIITVLSDKEKIEAHLVSEFDRLKSTKKGTMLMCQDSSKMETVPDKSVDFVFTDPPYFDNIHYSELSNFFYVWLKLIVDDNIFEKESVDTEGEAIVNKTMNKSDEDYQKIMTRVFKECNRVLKDSGQLVFTFHHSKKKAWWAILSALMDSEFYVIDSFSIQSEYKVNPHIRMKNAMDMDLILMCKKRSSCIEANRITKESLIKETIERVIYIEDLTKNGLFLKLVGALFKNITASQKLQIDYPQFEGAMSEFEVFSNEMAIKNKKNEKKCEKEIVQQKLF
jgi:adenine-specific DNA methylase